MEYDYLVVGAGFAGAVLAERIASMDKTVLVIDKKDHIGGNSFDYYNEKGVLVHKYGPHLFHTNSEKVFAYLSRFTDWREFELRVKTFINGKLYPLPVNRDTLNQFFQTNMSSEEEVDKFLDKKRAKIINPENSEEEVVSKAGWEIYEKFFKNYTIKQWHLHPKKLNASVTARIPVRKNRDDRYFTDKYQAVPLQGYHKMFENMLSHPNITVRLNTRFDDIKSDIQYNFLVYTGCVDEYFGFKHGKLSYRSLRFEHENHSNDFYQEVACVNYPNDFDYMRIVEIKHATGQKHPYTTIVKEYSQSEGEPFYPIPTHNNEQVYEKYQREAERLNDVVFAGRLANYKYFNMDQVVETALEIFEGMKERYKTSGIIRKIEN